MSKPRRLTEDEFGEALAGFSYTAFRLELQPAYAEPCETALLRAFLAGKRLDPRQAVPELRDWYAQVARQTDAGKHIGRVRVQEDPPTPYQQFERWLDRWSIEAGETMRYMTREQAHRAGLLPAAGHTDWWLLDSGRLVVMHFDHEGHRVRTELDTRPGQVVRACAWRDLAVHHSVREQLSDVPA